MSKVTTRDDNNNNNNNSGGGDGFSSNSSDSDDESHDDDEGHDPILLLEKEKEQKEKHEKRIQQQQQQQELSKKIQEQQPVPKEKEDDNELNNKNNNNQGKAAMNRKSLPGTLVKKKTQKNEQRLSLSSSMSSSRLLSLSSSITLPGTITGGLINRSLTTQSSTLSNNSSTNNSTTPSQFSTTTTAPSSTSTSTSTSLDILYRSALYTPYIAYNNLNQQQRNENRVLTSTPTQYMKHLRVIPKSIHDTSMIDFITTISLHYHTMISSSTSTQNNMNIIFKSGLHGKNAAGKPIGKIDVTKSLQSKQVVLVTGGYYNVTKDYYLQNTIMEQQQQNNNQTTQKNNTPKKRKSFSSSTNDHNNVVVLASLNNSQNNNNNNKSMSMENSSCNGGGPLYTIPSLLLKQKMKQTRKQKKKGCSENISSIHLQQKQHKSIPMQDTDHTILNTKKRKLEQQTCFQTIDIDSTTNNNHNRGDDYSMTINQTSMLLNQMNQKWNEYIWSILFHQYTTTKLHNNTKQQQHQQQRSKNKKMKQQEQEQQQLSQNKNKNLETTIDDSKMKSEIIHNIVTAFESSSSSYNNELQNSQQRNHLNSSSSLLSLFQQNQLELVGARVQIKSCPTTTTKFKINKYQNENGILIGNTKDTWKIMIKEHQQKLINERDPISPFQYNMIMVPKKGSTIILQLPIDNNDRIGNINQDRMELYDDGDENDRSHFPKQVLSFVLTDESIL